MSIDLVSLLAFSSRTFHNAVFEPQTHNLNVYRFAVVVVAQSARLARPEIIIRDFSGQPSQPERQSSEQQNTFTVRSDVKAVGRVYNVRPRRRFVCDQHNTLYLFFYPRFTSFTLFSITLIIIIAVINNSTVVVRRPRSRPIRVTSASECIL